MSEENDPTSPNERSVSTPKCQLEKMNVSIRTRPSRGRHSSIQSVHKMCQELLEKQSILETSISEIVGKLSRAEEKADENHKYLKQDQQEKLNSIQSKLNEIDEKLKPEESSKIEGNDVSADTTTLANPSQQEKNSEVMSTYGKYFVLKHKFKNVSSMENGKKYFSEKEEHFGVPWKMYLRRDDGYLSFFLSCSLLKDTEKEKEIKVEYELKIVSPNSREKKLQFCCVFKSHGLPSWGVPKFIEWNELVKDFVVDDCFCAEIAVKIKKTTGIFKENLRSFDETMEEFSDVVLIVNDEKFFVSKLYLAAHSPYFKVLFLGHFNESKKSEIKLSGIDADDFQKYLEVLYAEQQIDEFTVEGILMVADMYETPLVIRKCEEFLVKESKKTLKKKLELSTRYNLEALKKECLGEIKSVARLQSVIPENIHNLDKSMMAEFLQKALSLLNSK